MLLDATPAADAPTRAAAIARAADILAAGDLLGLPTETVYGLAARADDDAAVAAIFTAKGRPSSHPLIVHVADPAGGAAFAAEGFLQQEPRHAAALMQAFWPGPLTVIVPRRPGMGTAAAGGQDSIGLRCPSHPVAQAVLRAAAERGVAGVAAPSANHFGRISPTTAQHVVQEFGAALAVLDGGTCSVGIESTIVDCTRGQPVLLRPGMVSVEEIARRTGIQVLLPGQERTAQAAPRASGTLESHYAPHARVRLMSATELQVAADALPADRRVAIWSRSPLQVPPQVLWRAMPAVAEQAAHALFACLRDFDAQDMHEIWVETVPTGSAWAGVADRLRRAAA